MSKKTNVKPVLILNKGTGNHGKDAQLNNIRAARVISEVLKSSLGPKGMDKMLINNFGDIIITNDGRKMLQEMDLQHPVARMMVDLSKAIDDEVGDGTTSSVVVTGELLAKAEQLINKGIHPTLIIDGYEKAAVRALEALESIAISMTIQDVDGLEKIAATALESKILADLKSPLSKIIVSAILSVRVELDGVNIVDLNDIMVEKKLGESLTDTSLIQGIIVNKELLHPLMSKSVNKAKIALVDKALDIEKAKFDSKLTIENPEQIEEFIKQEEIIIGRMVDKIADSGANVLILQEDLNTAAYYLLTKRGISAVKRVKQSTMRNIAKATGAHIVTNLDVLSGKDLGYAELVEERAFGEDKLLFIEGCKNPHSVTIFIRGTNKRVLDEAERSIHDALCVVRDVVKEQKIVAGGGAPEMEVAKAVRKLAVTFAGKEQLAAMAYAEALEIVPEVLSENAGLNPIDILQELKNRHEKNEVWAGVNVFDGKVRDMKALEVYEPLSVKKQIVKSATDAAVMILKVDELVSTKKSIKREEEPKSGRAREEYLREKIDTLPF